MHELHLRRKRALKAMAEEDTDSDSGDCENEWPSTGELGMSDGDYILSAENMGFSPRYSNSSVTLEIIGLSGLSSRPKIIRFFDLSSTTSSTTDLIVIKVPAVGHFLSD